MKLFLSAGHTNIEGQDRGAFGNGKWEGDLTVEFRDILIAELKQLGINPITDNNKNALSQTLAYFKALTNTDSLVIDIHFNSSENKDVHGTEVYIPEISSDYEKQVGAHISELIAAGLKTRNRGIYPESVSAHKRLGWMRLIGENILIEICYISNYSDMFSYENSKSKLAKDLAKYLASVISVPEKQPDLMESNFKPKFMPV